MAKGNRPHRVVARRTVHLGHVPACATSHARPLSYLPHSVAILFLLAAFSIPHITAPAAVPSLAVTFVSIVLEALPFMLLGSVVGGVIEVFVSTDRMAAWLPRTPRRAVLLAAALGTVLPVCECAVVPVVRRLLRKGFPVSAAVAYMLGGPVVNPIVGASTAVAYGGRWGVVALRLSGGYLIAVCVGLLMGRLFPGRSAMLPDTQDRTDHDSCACHCQHDHAHRTQEGHEGRPEDKEAVSHAPASLATQFGNVFQHAADDFLSTGHYLVIGAFLAAVAQTYVAREAFAHSAGATFLPILAMMVLAVCLNLCSEADAFVAASFQRVMPLPAQVAFMVLGPMLDLKLLLMYQTVFRKRAIVALAISVALTVMLVSLGVAFVGWTK